MRWGRLKQACDGHAVYGLNVPADAYDSAGVRMIRTSDITVSGDLSPDSNGVFVDAALVDGQFVRAGDLLFSRSGTIGRCLRWRWETPATFAGYLVRFRPNAASEPRFIEYCAQAKFFQDEATASAIQSTILNLNAERYGSLHLPLPDVGNQRLVADYLDDETSRVDDLIREQQRLVRLNRERFESWREGLLTGAPDVTCIPLARLTDPARPIVYGIVQAGPNVPDGVPYIKTGDLDRLEPDLLSRTTREIDEVYRRSKVVPGDLVIAMRASIGAVVAIPETIPAANLTQGTARIAPAKGVSAAWLLHALRTQFVQDEAVVRAVGSTFRTLNIADLRRLPVPYVPAEAQIELADRLDKGETRLLDLERELNAQINLLQEHRQALITYAVTQGIDGLAGAA